MGNKITIGNCCIGVCLVILTFFKNYLHDELGGYIAVLILVSTKAFTLIHGARRGDFDSVLIFFQVLSVLKFYEYFLTKKSKKLYVAFIAIAFAVLTKSIVGFLILPGLIFASVLFEKFHFVYKNKHLYFALVSCLLVIAIYYLLRNYYNPGYLLAVYENELGGRYLNALEGNKGYMLLYFHGLTARYLLWLFFVPLGVYVAHQKEGILKEFVSVLSLIVVIFFLIISSSKTKLLWYDLPIYPFLGMIFATYFSQNKGDESTLGKMYVFSIVFMFNYAFIVKQVINNHSTIPRALGTFNVATYLKNKINEGIEGKKINIINQDEESVNVNRFYINKLKSLNNVVNYVSVGDLIDGDIVIVCKPVEEEQIIERYEVRLIENYKGVKLYTIKQ